MGERSLDEERAALYALAPGEFTAARDARARELRAAGAREQAEAVRRLPRPSVAAWAVNLLARRRPEALGALLATGDELRAAQRALLEGGGDPERLAGLIERERRQADELTDEARTLLVGAGGSAPAVALERVRETLHAGALDEEVGARVRAGTLAREERSLGIATLAAGDGEGDGAASTGDARLQGARAAQREAQAAVRRAGVAVRRAEAGAEQALRALETARRRLAAAEAAREEASAAVERLRRRG